MLFSMHLCPYARVAVIDMAANCHVVTLARDVKATTSNYRVSNNSANSFIDYYYSDRILWFNMALKCIHYM